MTEAAVIILACVAAGVVGAVIGVAAFLLGLKFLP